MANITTTQELYDALGETSAVDIVLLRDKEGQLYEVVAVNSSIENGVTIVDIDKTK